MVSKLTVVLLFLFVAIITLVILIVLGFHLNMYAELLNFVASLVDFLSWPVAVILVINTLKPHLDNLISSIKSIETPWGKVQMTGPVQNITEQAEELKVDDETVLDELPEQPINQDPRISVLNTWASIEAAIERLAELNDLRETQKRRLSTYRRIELLRKIEVIDDPLANVLHEMRKIRNLIAHGHDIYIEDGAIQEFSLAALRVEAIIESIHYRQRDSDTSILNRTNPTHPSS